MLGAFTFPKNFDNRKITQYHKVLFYSILFLKSIKIVKLKFIIIPLYIHIDNTMSPAGIDPLVQSHAS